MQSATMPSQKAATTTPVSDENGNPFDLNVSVLEAGDGTAAFINLTDDGCKPTCDGSCASAAA